MLYLARNVRRKGKEIMSEKTEITYKLEVFEGPLDLLLHLIEKNKIDIYDIPIVVVTEQFLSYMDAMDKADPERMSSFIVMAAMLLRIKSNMMLPRTEIEQEELTDPREELIQRLLEYQKYKILSEELKDRQLDAGQVWYRQRKLPPEVDDFKEKPNLDEMLQGVTLKRLRAVFEEVLRRSEEKVDTVRSGFGKIEKETVSLSERMQQLEQSLKRHPNISFTHLLGADKTKLQVVVTFLAVLELMKIGSIRIVQEHIFDEIQIQSMR